jgi:hypothetical protein
MGKKVAGHGDVKRGLEIESYAEEAVIAWNAPPLAQSRWLCEEALQPQYKDSKTDWRSAFSHSEARNHHGPGANRKSAGHSPPVVRFNNQMEGAINQPYYAASPCDIGGTWNAAMVGDVSALLSDYGSSITSGGVWRTSIHMQPLSLANKCLAPMSDPVFFALGLKQPLACLVAPRG